MIKVFLFLNLIAIQAWSYQKIETRFKSSEESLTSTIGYHYGGDEFSIWSTDITLTGIRAEADDNTVEDQVVRDLQWINAWTLPASFFVEIGAGGSESKMNDLETRNADLTIGREYLDFYFFTWGVSAGSNYFKQRGATLPSGDDLDVTQERIGFSLSMEPYEWLSITVFGNKYSYNKNIDRALLIFETNLAINRYGTAFSEAMAGFLNREFGFNFGFYLNKKWRLNLAVSEMEDEPDPNVIGRDTNIKLSHKFSRNWDGNVTLGSTYYESTSLTPSAKFNYAGLGAGFAW